MQPSELSNPSPSLPLSLLSYLSKGFLLLSLVGCHPQTLKVRTEYLDPTYLASYQASTPDPCRSYYYGEQIVVHWNLPSEALTPPSELVLNLRFGTYETQTVRFPLTCRKGRWIYRLINDDYWRLEGILSYQILVCQEGELLDSWSHHIWSDLININDQVSN